MASSKVEILEALFFEILFIISSIWENGLLVGPMGFDPKAECVKIKVSLNKSLFTYIN
jgi:hypothetical protein